jgi:hypothetical protein
MNKRVTFFTCLIAGLWLVVLVATLFFMREMGQSIDAPESAPLQEPVPKQEPPRPSQNEEKLATSRFAIPPQQLISPLPPHPEAKSIGDPRVTPTKEIEALANILVSYSESIGALPTAEDNSRVMSQLRGANPAKRAWFPPEHPRVNNKGELLDAHGTPYNFHFESSQKVTLRSAGSDREFFTDDDLVH